MTAKRARRQRIPRIPKGRRIDVRREEFNQLVDLLNERGKILNGLIHEQQIQLQRIAQLQVELDRLKAALGRTEPKI